MSIETTAPWQPVHGLVGQLTGWGLSSSLSTAVVAGVGPVIAKSDRPHVAHVPGGSARVSAALAAAAAGLGPAVVDVGPADGRIVQVLRTDLAPGTLGRLSTYGAVEAVLAARVAFRGLDVDLPVRDLASDVRALQQVAEQLGYHAVDEVRRLFPLVDPIAEAVADGPAPEPSWGPADTSNVLVGPTGEVQLVGGTLAGLLDPLADVALVLNDLAPALLDDGDVMQATWGDDHPGAYARVRLYTVLDDLRSALYAVVAELTSGTPADDYWGFHNYRVRRAQLTAFGSGRFDTWLADAATGWQ